MGNFSLDRRYSVLLHPNIPISHAVNILSVLGLLPESSLTNSVKEAWTAVHKSPFHSYVGNNVALWTAIERWYKLYGLENAKWFRSTSRRCRSDGPQMTSMRDSDTTLQKAGIDMNLIDLCFSFQAVLDRPIGSSRNISPVPTTDVVIISGQENTEELCDMARKRNPLLAKDKSFMFGKMNQCATVDFMYNMAFPLELQMWIVSLSSVKSKSEVIQIFPCIDYWSQVDCVKNWLAPIT
ncbi:cyclin 11 [Perkinsela sp. CCAP 1560/4]|nr:cyclin 11 [Perkinsela sp. CCAP 1560/4]|eukprot:KNH04733.1 cyclin 11 [Perkinsela sp. CCAP 1560/4]